MSFMYYVCQELPFSAPLSPIILLCVLMFIELGHTMLHMIAHYVQMCQFQVYGIGQLEFNN